MYLGPGRGEGGSQSPVLDDGRQGAHIEATTVVGIALRGRCADDVDCRKHSIVWPGQVTRQRKGLTSLLLRFDPNCLDSRVTSLCTDVARLERQLRRAMWI